MLGSEMKQETFQQQPDYVSLDGFEPLWDTLVLLVEKLLKILAA